MNLRQHENSAEAKTQNTAWYSQPETMQPVSPAPVSTPTLFEPSAAERILARAGALQEVHGQMLSPEQIEAIADEIGIQPEFVQLAIAQEKAGTLSQAVCHGASHRRRTRIVATAGACVFVAATYLATYFRKINGPAVGIIMLTFPFVLSFVLGALGRSRRAGAISGLAIAAAVLSTLSAVWLLAKTSPGYRVFDIFFFAIVMSSFAGAAGAQVRCMVTRRQITNRNRRATRGRRRES